ncbi:hypothetical protein TNCV_2689171, partial [Trichonephila clavipes]
MVGCCTKTMPLTKPYLSRNFRPAKNITVMEHPPYSPDLAPCDFVFVQLNLAGRHTILPHLKRL